MARGRIVTAKWKEVMVGDSGVCYWGASRLKPTGRILAQSYAIWGAVEEQQCCWVQVVVQVVDKWLWLGTAVESGCGWEQRWQLGVRRCGGASSCRVILMCCLSGWGTVV